MMDLSVIHAVITTLDSISFPISQLRRSGDVASALAGCVNALEEFCIKNEQEEEHGE